MAEVAEPALEESPETRPGDAGGDWLCAWCLNGVAQEQDRFAFNGQDTHRFSNPEGIRFEIILFSRTRGCRQAGVPTLEYTWFPGHAWSYCQCARCGQHLGWFYDGPHQFAGLITHRIVRAVCVRN